MAELLAQIGRWLGVFHPDRLALLRALGATFIYFTPEWLKEFGIRLFGQSDKVALGVSMTGTLLMLGALIGLVGRRRPRWAVGIAIALIVITGIAVLTRPHASVVDLIPTIVGGLVGIWFLVTALRIALLDPESAPAAETAKGTGATAGSRQRRTQGRPMSSRRGRPLRYRPIGVGQGRRLPQLAQSRVPWIVAGSCGSPASVH